MLPIAAVLIAAALTVVFVLKLGGRKLTKLPSGPPGWPLLGNLPDLPKVLLHLKLDEWAQKYGAIYSFFIGSQPVIVLNNIKVAADILDRMSGVTSDRPQMIKAIEFYTRNSLTTLLHHNDVFRATRRADHASLNPRASAKYLSLQEEEAHYTVQELLRDPAKPLHEHLYRFSASVIFRAVYGGAIIPGEGPNRFEKLENLVLQLMYTMMPGKSIVDLLPFLQPIIAASKWLRRESDVWFNSTNEELSGYYDTACKAEGNIAHDMDEHKEEYGLSKHYAIWAAGTLFINAQETTQTALRYFALSMLLYPDVVKKAQEQLDAVVGGRPPTFEDRSRLPYIDAIVKEGQRWRAGVPLGIFRIASQDFEYQGYVIPKGALIMDNIWTQSRDPALYPDPDAFEPERYLDEKGQLKAPVPDTHGDYLAFGHGRRYCPGKDFAVNSMFIITAYMLWAFRFEKPIDQDGKESVPDPMAFVDSYVTVQPALFGVQLIPRWDDLGQRLAAAVHSTE